MFFVLAEDQTIIHMGPIHWAARRFQSELDEHGITVKLPQTNESYIQINGNLAIYPVAEITAPTYDGTFQQLEGPFWTFTSNTASATYNVIDRNLSMIKSELKQRAAAERYRKECMGVATTIQSQEVLVETDRETRNIFVQQFLLMPDNAQSNWKFPGKWLNLTKQDLGNCIAAGVTHIQSAFDWESNLSAYIDSCSSIEELQNLEIEEPKNPLLPL